MKRIIPYHFYKKIDEMDVHKELLGDKYIIHFNEDGRLVGIHFYFDDNGDLIIDNVYKSRTNYNHPRYLKKYKENKELVNAMMQLNTKHLKTEGKQMIKVSKEKWNLIDVDYKGVFHDYQGKHPEWIGKRTVKGSCVTDNPQYVGVLLVESVHFVIEE